MEAIDAASAVVKELAALSSPAECAALWDALASHLCVALDAASAPSVHAEALALLHALDRDAVAYAGWQFVTVLAELLCVSVEPTLRRSVVQAMQRIFAVGSPREVLLTFPDALVRAADETAGVDEGAMLILLEGLSRLVPGLKRSRLGIIGSVAPALRHCIAASGCDVTDAVLDLIDVVRPLTRCEKERLIWTQTLLCICAYEEDEDEGGRWSRIIDLMTRFELQQLRDVAALVADDDDDVLTLGAARYIMSVEHVHDRVDLEGGVGRSVLRMMQTMMESNGARGLDFITRVAPAFETGSWTPQEREERAIMRNLLQTLSSAFMSVPAGHKPLTRAIDALLCVLPIGVRFEILQDIVSASPLGGGAAFMLRRMKDEFHRGYDDVEFGAVLANANVLSLLERLLELQPDAQDSALHHRLQRFDVLSSALNFYRFLLLRDRRDLTAVADSRRTFDDRFASRLRLELDSAAEKLLQRGSNDDLDELMRSAADAQIHVVRGVLERTCELCAQQELEEERAAPRATTAPPVTAVVECKNTSPSGAATIGAGSDD